MKNLLSIDIGSRNIHIVEGSCVNGIVKAAKVSNVHLGNNIINNGVINDYSSLMNSIKPALLTMKSKAKNTIITIGGGSVIIREFEVPDGTEQEINAMVKNEMINSYNGNAADVVQYEKIGEKTTEKSKKITVRAASISGSVVDSYIKLLKELKLKPFIMDIQTNSIARLFSGTISVNGENVDEKRIIYLDIGASTTTAYIIQSGKIEFSRIILTGMSELDKILSAAYSISEDKAEEIKTENFDASAINDDSDISLSIRGFFLNLQDEIYKIIQYNNSRITPQKQIDHIYILPETAH